MKWEKTETGRWDLRGIKDIRAYVYKVNGNRWNLIIETRNSGFCFIETFDISGEEKAKINCVKALREIAINILENTQDRE